MKITTKKDDKSSITDFSELDMYLANTEKNTYKDIISFQEIASKICKGWKRNTYKPHKTPKVIRPKHLGCYIQQSF